MSIKTTGLDSINRKLDNLINMPRKLIPVGREIGELMQRQMELYPPALPTYQRTFQLKNSMDYDVIESANGVKVLNFSYGATGRSGRYDHRVKGPQSQAWMHQGRWTTTAGDLEARRGDIMGMARDAVNGVVR